MTTHPVYTKEDLVSFFNRVLYDLKEVVGFEFVEEATITKVKLIIGNQLRKQGRISTTVGALHRYGISLNRPYEACVPDIKRHVVVGVIVLEDVKIDEITRAITVTYSFDNE